MNLVFEFFPLALFFGAFLFKDIYFALIVLMVAMPIGVLVKYLRTKELDKIYFWSTIFLLIAGSMTLYFRNPMFLYWKPTVFYWVIAIAFLGSQFIGDKPLVKRFFGVVEGMQLDGLSASDWRKLNFVWVLFFVGAGLLNIYVAYNFSEDFWVKFKVFGLMALTFVFMLIQSIWLAKKLGFEDDNETPEEER